MENISRKDKEKQYREREIIEKAGELFCKNGYDNTTLDELAKEAQYTKKTIYNYFTCKEDIFFAVVIEGYAKLAEITYVEGKKGDTGLEKIKSAIKGYHKFYVKNPEMLRLMNLVGILKNKTSGQVVPFRDKFMDMNSTMFNDIIKLFEDGKKDGSISSEFDISITAYSFIFLVTGFFNLMAITGDNFTENFDLDKKNFIETSLKLLIKSIK